MHTITLQASTRTEKGHKTDALRAEGKVPAIVYGAGTEPISITIDRNAFIKVFKEAGESSLLELMVDQNAPMHVLIQDIQQDALSDQVVHADFRSIDMDKEVEAVVELEFVGESLAVKALGGTLIPSRTEVTIRCLPNKLMRCIKVDISKLQTFNDVITVSDLQVPEGVVIDEDPGLSLAVVEEPRSEEEMKRLDEAVQEDVAGVKVETKEKEVAEGTEENKTTEA